ncbi:MAG: hypothetical protein INF90_12425 [Roseomonas sp.]|nr:hypothetical protein [Roseomonas sp.]
MEITYLCPAVNNAVGGIKVIYKHSEMLTKCGISSSVYHPRNPDFMCTWFDHNTTIRRNRPLVTGEDFLVIPEMWALFFGDRCLKTNTDYAIFVQNGYLLELGVPPQQYERLKTIYENARVLMSISTDTTEAICAAYPKLDRSLIHRLLPHISQSFRPAKKEKIISYMPRKLPEHARKMSFFLSEYMRDGWKLVPINNMTESETAEVLGRSSIFLSFCDQEGCPLPPLEAALSGALVIGYTGQGAKEYFCEPNFWPIENGNFIAFVHAVEQSMRNIENGLLDKESFRNGISSLRSRYGQETELNHLLQFARATQRLESNSLR